MGGRFCKHAVAVALVATDAVGDADQRAEASIDIPAYLAGLDHNALVDLLVERAAEDDVFDARLRMSAARATARPPPIAVFRHAVDEAFVVRDYVDYRHMYDYASTINSALDSRQELLDDGHAEAVIALAERAIDRAEDALGHVDDSDGYMSGIAKRLQEMHRNACAAAQPEPVALARTLLERERHSGDLDVFHGAVTMYAEILGAAGIAEYRRLAKAEWDGLPPLGPGQEDRSYSSRRLRITQIMRLLPSWPATSTPSRRCSPAINRRPTSSSASPSCVGRRDRTTMRWHGPSRGWRCTAGRIRDCSKRQPRRTTGPVGGRTPYGSPGTPTTTHRPCALAGAAARAAGCRRDLCLELARRREGEHSLDAIPVWQGEIERAINAKNNQVYAEAVELMVRVRRLLIAADREADFAPYLARVRAANKPKRNLIKLFDERSW